MPNTTYNTISVNIIDSSLDYKEYRLMVDQLLEKNLTTGPVQSEKLLEYAKLNNHRMNRLDKHTVVPEIILNSLENAERKMDWIVITEGWCGDAAQVIPVLNKITSLTDKIELRMILRDEHPEIMDNYLTNGTRAIPIVIGLDTKTQEELFVWGPKPLPAMKILEQLKNDSLVTPEERSQAIQLWYSRDRSVTLFAEFAELIDTFGK
jgi:hypothetical protein